MSGEVAQDTDCYLDAFGDSVMLWSPSERPQASLPTPIASLLGGHVLAV